MNLGDGDVDWAAERRAFAEIGYSGSVIEELDGGDEAYLRDVSKRIDRLLIGVAQGLREGRLRRKRRRAGREVKSGNEIGTGGKPT